MILSAENLAIVERLCNPSNWPHHIGKDLLNRLLDAARAEGFRQAAGGSCGCMDGQTLETESTQPAP